MKRRNKKKALDAASYAVLIIGGILMLYPVYFVILSSVSTTKEFLAASILPLPHNPIAGLENYKKIFLIDKLVRSLGVTVLRFAVSIIVTLFISIMTGYAFARLRFPGKRIFFLILISGMMIPGVALMVPNYIWMSRFPLVGGNDITGQGGHGFVNNPALYFFTGWVGVFNIFLLRQAFKGIGGEIGESAKIDGAGFMLVVFSIYLPLVMPVISVIFLNTFIGTWNDYLTNYIYMPNLSEWHSIGNVLVNLMTVYSSNDLPGGPDYPAAFAMALVGMVPPIIVYAFTQKSFTEGLTMGAVKG